MARAKGLQAMGLVRSCHEGKHAAMRDVEAFWENKFQQRNLKEFGKVVDNAIKRGSWNMASRYIFMAWHGLYDAW